MYRNFCYNCVFCDGHFSQCPICDNQFDKMPQDQYKKNYIDKGIRPLGISFMHSYNLFKKSNFAAKSQGGSIKICKLDKNFSHFLYYYSLDYSNSIFKGSKTRFIISDLESDLLNIDYRNLSIEEIKKEMEDVFCKNEDKMKKKLNNILLSYKIYDINYSVNINNYVRNRLGLI